MTSRSDVRHRMALIADGLTTPEAEILMRTPFAPRWIDVEALGERLGANLIANRIDAGGDWRYWHALKRLLAQGWLSAHGGFTHAAKHAREFQLTPAGGAAVRVLQLVCGNKAMWPDRGHALAAVISADRSEFSFDVSLRDFAQSAQ